MLESNAPAKSWTRDQELAYWINAYNAYTLDLILEHYPVKSIKRHWVNHQNPICKYGLGHQVY